MFDLIIVTGHTRTKINKMNNFNSWGATRIIGRQLGNVEANNISAGTIKRSVICIYDIGRQPGFNFTAFGLVNSREKVFKE